MNTKDAIVQICRDVAELPDRNSPEDQPDMMLVTPEELETILKRALPPDAFPALHALTEAVLTRADKDYMDRCLAEAVRIMGTRGWTPPVPFPV